ncbi:hypothetical protein BLIN9172_02114 [Brevibacterium linens ATCC 9172]|uniref:Uncharacterized protein n=1 Tax=Brevibacterium linens ATCC 9172 TaxID=1255617 RepID=A0A2H1JGF1_BRELN|nr:hypothetical protein BLIN9172_02114 [Brevibacterium linens ATCC 9172]
MVEPALDGTETRARMMGTGPGRGVNKTFKTQLSHLGGGYRSRRSQRTGASGPSGMPRPHHRKNSRLQLIVMHTAKGRVCDASVPMPALF